MLKNEVRGHYKTFLETNQEINLIESNVTDLKLLIESTTELVKVFKLLIYKCGVRYISYNTCYFVEFESNRYHTSCQ